jgi:apolipoprotein N-acyltransferase
VELAHKLAIVGIFTLGCAVVAVAMLIFEVLLGWGWGLAAAAVTAALLITLWLVIPWTVRARSAAPPR